MNPLFAERLNRADIMALPPMPRSRNIRIAVHRNHGFELAAPALNAFLGLSGLEAEFWYSDYDDSLSFARLPETADIHLFWLDAARYANLDFTAWLCERAAALRRLRPGKQIMACLGAAAPEPSPPDALWCDLEACLAPLGREAFDPRMDVLAGTRLSGEAALQAAREIGARLIPALLFPALKALVLDLDNTLHAGVLGEDGIEGVRPYTEVQAHLKALAARGFLLTLASKNEEEDVRGLFAARPDYPLRLEDFTALRVNWRPKAENIAALAAELNIGFDAMLFVDDNPGEILRAARALPGLRVLEAASPEATLAALRWQPGLYKSALTPEDALRGADIKANSERTRLRESLESADYLRELALELRLCLNPAGQAERVTELLRKTNQFVLALQRPARAEVDAFFEGEGRCAVTAAMRDRLSDSGVIAALLAENRNGALAVAELAVSCRALGRGVEGEMIAAMLELARARLGAGPETRTAYTKGPRNAPALAWLRAASGESLEAEAGEARIGAPFRPKLEGVRFFINGEEQ